MPLLFSVLDLISLSISLTLPVPAQKIKIFNWSLIPSDGGIYEIQEKFEMN